MINNNNNQSEKLTLSLSGVTKTFKSGDEEIKGINDLSLNIQNGQFVIVMGPSGSGKSTLINLIAGLTDFDKGEIFINDHKLSQLSEKAKSLLRRHEVGIVFQFYNLHEGLTALENVELPMMIADVPLKERRENARNLLKMVGLEKRMLHRPHELSGGEKQRVGIARALSNNAKLILADEPTGDLDHELGVEIMDLFHRINKDQGVSIIMVTHDSSIIRKGFRLVRLVDGQLSSDQIINDLTDISDDFSSIVSQK